MANKEWALQCVICFYANDGDTKDADFCIAGVGVCVSHVDMIQDDVVTRAVEFAKANPPA